MIYKYVKGVKTGVIIKSKVGFKTLEECTAYREISRRLASMISVDIEFVIYEDVKTGLIVRAFPDVKNLSRKELTVLLLSSTVRHRHG